MGIMLVYDITNAKSFDNIAKWLRNIDEVNFRSFPLLDTPYAPCKHISKLIMSLFYYSMPMKM